MVFGTELVSAVAVAVVREIRRKVILYSYSTPISYTAAHTAYFGYESKLTHFSASPSTHAQDRTHLRSEALREAADDIPQSLLKILAQCTLLVNSGKQIRLVALQVGKEVLLPLGDLADWDLIQVTVDTSEDKRNHLVDSHWRVLLLLEELGKTLTTVQGLLGSGIKIGAELGESGDLTVLGQEELERTSDLLHGLELGSGTDTGHRQTDVDGWADTLVEELSLQEDLAVGDGNDVGWNVGRHITTLGLDDGQSSEGTATVLVAHLGGTLEETRVEVEHIAWVRLGIVKLVD